MATKNPRKPTTGEDFDVTRDDWGGIRDSRERDLGSVAAEFVRKDRGASASVENGKRIARLGIDAMVNVEAGVEEADAVNPSFDLQRGVAKAAEALRRKNENLKSAQQHFEQNAESYKAAAIEEANADGVSVDYNGKTYSYEQEKREQQD